MPRKSGTTTNTKKRATSRGRDKINNAKSAQGRPHKSPDGDKASPTGSKLRSLMSSPAVRSVVAAGLTAAAAALLYRKPKSADDQAPATQSSDTEAPALAATVSAEVSKTARKVRRRAADAAHAVTDTAKSAVAKARDTPETSARDEQTPSPTDERRPRKQRSDAGTKRKPRQLSQPAVAPVAIEPIGFDQTETSPLALGAPVNAAEETTPSTTPSEVTDEVVAEAHPS